MQQTPVFEKSHYRRIKQNKNQRFLLKRKIKLKIKNEAF